MLTFSRATWNNQIGIPYILMSKAPGYPLSDYDWSNNASETGAGPSWSRFNEGKEKLMTQLGGLVSQLLDTRLEKIGSLFENPDGTFRVGQCLSPSLVWQSRNTLEAINRGPFCSDTEYFESLVSAFTLHAKGLPLAQEAFFAPIPKQSEYPTWDSYKSAVDRWEHFVAIGQKIDSSKNRLSYCIAGQLLGGMIPSLSVEAPGGFPLLHPDLHWGNIFVDNDLNITCLID